ncbi:MAG: ABC transporter substrate-binding protein [Alphaproteobacteria bacterium]|nr:MAG: ABC transporter substrate-binding protein [Alphaproteobacteria bacterium]
MVPRLGFAFAAVITLAAQTSTMAADRIRLAVQRTGTLAWELDVIRMHGLDREFDLAIETVELASTEAGKIALKGGSADLMLSDWIWVARERSLGDNLVFYPSSSTLGAVMVPAHSSIREIVGLRGKKLAVAGGPLDKSWLLLQALARQSGLDLKKQTTVFCADLESIAMDDVMKGLGARGPVALVGYTFDSTWAARNGSTVERFLAAARQAKDILASSEAEWQRLAPRIRVGDANALAIYRQRYGEGIVRRPLAEEEADARALYLVLAEIGGAELVGPARELAAGTFYRPAAAE